MRMTTRRANVLRLLSEYCVLGYKLTLWETPKLLYFLQSAGEPLPLRFAQGNVGPYAGNLRHVLHQAVQELIEQPIVAEQLIWERGAGETKASGGSGEIGTVVRSC